MGIKTIQQFINELEAKKKAIEENIPLAKAAADTHAKMVERIFIEGLDKEGFKRSYNSTDEIYIGKSQSPVALTPKGKPSDRAKKVAKTLKTRLKDFGYTKSESKAILQRKTTYFESYKAFRGAIGRENSFWNLNLFGLLELDFSNGLTRDDDNTWTERVKTQRSIDILKNPKHNLYFGLTDDERQNFKDVLLKEALKILT